METQQYTASPIIKFFTSLKRNQVGDGFRTTPQWLVQGQVYIHEGFAYHTNRFLIIREPVLLPDQVIIICPITPNLEIRGDAFLAEHWTRYIETAEKERREGPPLELTGKEIYDHAWAAYKVHKRKDSYCELPGEEDQEFQAIFLADIFRRMPKANVKIYLPDWSKVKEANEGLAVFQWDGGKKKPNQKMTGQAVVRTSQVK